MIAINSGYFHGLYVFISNVLVSISWNNCTINYTYYTYLLKLIGAMSYDIMSDAFPLGPMTLFYCLVCRYKFFRFILRIKLHNLAKQKNLYNLIKL